MLGFPVGPGRDGPRLDNGQWPQTCSGEQIGLVRVYSYDLGRFRTRVSLEAEPSCDSRSVLDPECDSYGRDPYEAARLCARESILRECIKIKP